MRHRFTFTFLSPETPTSAVGARRDEAASRASRRQPSRSSATLVARPLADVVGPFFAWSTSASASPHSALKARLC